MEVALQKFYSYGLATTTKKAYSSGQKRFLDFCSKYKLPSDPPTENTILLFISQLGEDGLAVSTIRLYLSAIRNLLINLGLFSVTLYSPRVELVLRGIKRFKANRGVLDRSRLPITPSVLRKLKRVWSTNPNSYSNRLFWAAACLGFFGFLRCAEFTVPSASSYDRARHLSLSDVSFSRSTQTVSRLAIKIKQSKTDPFAKGVSIFLSKTGTDLCPVSALLDYLVLRGPHDGPLFTFKDASPLTRVRLVEEMQKALSVAGIDASHYTGHSFRIGAATTALKAGVSDAKIKMLGRWESSAYQCYLQTSREELASVSSVLAHSPI